MLYGKDKEGVMHRCCRCWADNVKSDQADIVVTRTMPFVTRM
jgi:hypothetical protein